MVDRQKTLVVDGGAARIAELEAENERLVEANIEQLQLSIQNHHRAEAAERALAERAGGVKVERDKMHRRAQIAESLYQSVTDTLRMWREVLGPSRHHDDFALFSFALADMEKAKARIEARLSDLTTEPAAPEGRQEAVAWVRKWNFRGTPCADEFTNNANLAEQWRTHPQTNDVIPLYTHTSGEVTEAMVKRARTAFGEAFSAEAPEGETVGEFRTRIMRSTIEAALRGDAS